MVVEDEALKYQTTYDQVSKAIMKLKDIGIDITKLEEELNKINKEVEENINKVDILVGNFGIELYYQNGITKLNKLLNIINNYNFYYQIDHLIKLIDVRIKTSSNISLEGLDNYINQIKTYLSQIKTSSTIIYKNEENLINRLYEIVYFIIKQEILLKDESDLLEYIKKSNTDIEKLDSIIRNDLQNERLRENKDIIIKSYELESKGITSNLLDLDLLRLIVRSDCKELFVISDSDSNKDSQTCLGYKEQFEEKIHNIEVNNERIEELNKEISSVKEEKKNLKSNIRKYKIKLGTKIVSVVLVLSSLTSLGVVATKKFSTVEKCKTITTTYTEGEDTPIEEEGYKEKNDSQMRIILEEKDPYVLNQVGTYERDIKTYDVTDIKTDEIEDYFDMNLDDRIPTIKHNEENLSDISTGEFYTKTLRQLIIESQDFEDSKEEIDKTDRFLYAFEYLLVLGLIYWLLTVVKNKVDVFNLYRIKEYLEEIKKLKANYKINNKDYKRLLNELKELIKETHSLEYDSYDYFKISSSVLLDDHNPDEMYELHEMYEYLKELSSKTDPKVDVLAMLDSIDEEEEHIQYLRDSCISNISKSKILRK